MLRFCAAALQYVHSFPFELWRVHNALTVFGLRSRTLHGILLAGVRRGALGRRGGAARSTRRNLRPRGQLLCTGRHSGRRSFSKRRTRGVVATRRGRWVSQVGISADAAGYR